MFAYESDLLARKAAGPPREPLTLIYPADGVVSADFPLVLLPDADRRARTNNSTVVEHLLRPTIQYEIMTSTHRRPALSSVDLADEFDPNPDPAELPLTLTAEASGQLVESFGSRLRRPARTIYLLDTSGSMAQADRLPRLKAAFRNLTGDSGYPAGPAVRFQGREEVVLLPCNDMVGAPQRFTAPEADPGPVLGQISGRSEPGRCAGPAVAARPRR